MLFADYYNYKNYLQSLLKNFSEEMKFETEKSSVFDPIAPCINPGTALNKELCISSL